MHVQAGPARLHGGRRSAGKSRGSRRPWRWARRPRRQTGLRHDREPGRRYDVAIRTFAAVTRARSWRRAVPAATAVPTQRQCGQGAGHFALYQQLTHAQNARLRRVPVNGDDNHEHEAACPHIAWPLLCLSQAVAADDRPKEAAPAFQTGVERVTVDVVVAGWTARQSSGSREKTPHRGGRPAAGVRASRASSCRTSPADALTAAAVSANPAPQRARGAASP